eukprot:gnl/MRDRNA2_/MRDRNA2_81255_c0_seq2.p1 gnl/MRDRNA2_/MRDRNA2_81255_c0~~gnl/MRDRNA2_/MRDRNA2_81255_c0_seq2.p1  ORF type:complete len:162 (+),score=27.25 gnl/MRDRNA2_/MRDRNA2_81255_c0_seq2:495-980(+)
MSGKEITEFEGAEYGPEIGALIGIVFGLAGLVGACVVGICMCYRSRQTQIQQHNAVQAQLGNRQVQVATPANVLNVQCPVGVNAGDQLQVEDPRSGQMFQVSVPAGVSAGQTFAVQMLHTPTVVAAPSTVVGRPLQDNPDMTGTNNEKPVTGQPVLGQLVR